MSEQEERIVYEWEDTGRLEIDVRGNQSATLRFTPAQSLFENIPPKFRKINANKESIQPHPFPTTEITTIKSQNSASHEPTVREHKERTDMEESKNLEPFAQLSRQAMTHIIAKDFEAYSRDLHEMSCIVSEEKKYRDLLKISMMKFHIDLSGLNGEPYIDPVTIEFAREAIMQAQIDSESVDKLFRDTIKAPMTPSHCFTVVGSLRMFHLALENGNRKIGVILSHAIKTGGNC